MRVLRRMRHLFCRRRLEAEMAEEMQFHLEQRTAGYVADGLSDDAARLAAQRRFGNLGSLQEQARDAFGWGWLERAAHDVRLGIRQLVRAPGFTLLAVITLGLGIGVNTAMFCTLNSILLKPLPYPDSSRLDRIFRTNAQNVNSAVSPADFLDLSRAAGSYGEIAGYEFDDASFVNPGQPPEIIPALRVTPNHFSVLRLTPQLGRDFQPGDETPGNDRLALLSDRCWRNRFGGRADIIGRTIRINGEPHVIIGVMPPALNEWRHLGEFEVYRPLVFDGQRALDRTSTSIRLLGRRADKVTEAEAAAFMSHFGARLAADHPEVDSGVIWRVVRLQQMIGGANGRSMFVMLIGLSGFVLLIGCSNLANLLLARTIARAREFALRSALGASRAQLLRPLVVESLLLALAGGACAIVVAIWATNWLAVRSIDDNGQGVVLTLDWRVLGWAFAVSLITAVAFGLAPALFALRLNLNDTLKSGARGMTGSPGHQRFRQLLIIGQFALAMVLLAGAALFIRGLDELNHRRSGWTSDHLVTGSIVLSPARYPDADHIAEFNRVAAQRIQALPGVRTVSISSFTPFFLWPETRKFIVAGQPPPSPGHEPAAVVNCVSSGYFETYGTPLLAGRPFDGRDTANSPRVFIINQRMATALFGSQDPIGRHLSEVGGGDRQGGEIVGVAADVVSVVSDPVPTPFQLYQPIAQVPRSRDELAVRTTGLASSVLIDQVRRAIAGMDPDLPIRRLQPADAAIDRSNYQLAVLRDMLTSFAVLGLALASLGIYGIIARTMVQRTSEFAIRLALGARVRDITQLVLTAGVKLALLGAGLGLIGAVAVSQLLAAGFPAMHLDNPTILVGTTLFLIAVALIASWLPARRAGRVDAIVALRAE